MRAAKPPAGAEPPGAVARAVITIGGGASPLPPKRPRKMTASSRLPDRLVTELTAHRTLALRDALANDPDTAFVAVLHALCLGAFYRYASTPAWRSRPRAPSFSAQAPGLERHRLGQGDRDPPSSIGRSSCPRTADDSGTRWSASTATASAALFAHCASLSVNAVHEPWNRSPTRIAHADRLAQAVGLDMAAAGWAPTVDNYLGRVTKARILEAVREAKGEAAAQLIDHLKKPDMAKEAERLLAATGWLPEPLRTPTTETLTPEAATDAEAESLPAFLAAEDDVQSAAPEPSVIAAE